MSNVINLNEYRESKKEKRPLTAQEQKVARIKRSLELLEKFSKELQEKANNK
jgi:hypothetical protein